MQMSVTAVIIISLSVLLCDWVGVKAAPNFESSERHTKFDDSDVYSDSKNPTSDHSSAKLSLKNTRAGNWRITRETPTQSDSPPKPVSVNSDPEIKNVSTDNVLPTTLIRKIVSILGKKPPSSPETPATPIITGDPNKQLFGGRLPPFIERIIQRIQNYFSVYNPPEYFDSNRPSPPSSGTPHTTIALICTNTTEGGQSCGGTSSSEEQEEEDQQGETLEMCDGNDAGSSNFQGGNSGNVDSPQDEYNVVVTHTIVQDSSLNVYSPAPAPEPVPFSGLNGNVADSAHMVSNVVVILEPAAGQYSPPPLDNPDKNKFYVYVNPTSANKNQQKLKTWNESTDTDSDSTNDKTSNFQPFVNATYTVIIRGDKLQEYNTDLQNADNNWANPEIAIYVRNATKTLKKCKLPSQPFETDADAQDCDQNVPIASRSAPISRSANSSEEKTSNDDTMAEIKTKNTENSNKVPNINLLLVPPNDQPSKAKNKNCSSKNKVPTKNPQLEYYVLKPDNGNKPKTDDKEKPTFYLQKTSIGAATPSQTYLPPPSPSESAPVSGSSPDDQAQVTVADETKIVPIAKKNNSE